MGKYIGLDLGTTSISGLILDTESKAVLSHRSVPNDSEITTSEDKVKGYSEWDIEQMIKLAYSVLSDLADESNQMDINAIGVTGQMHGWCCLIRIMCLVHHLSAGRINVVTSFSAMR